VPKVQLLHRDLIAEFFRSKQDPPIYHYIIRKQGSPTIVAWSQCRTLQACQQDAGQALRYLAGTEDTPSLDFEEDDLDRIAI
jgi:hypothetical protein